MFKKNILVCENYIDENGVEWYNVKYLKLFAKESKFMKKMRILALVIAILSVAAMLFLVSCKDDAGKKGVSAVKLPHISRRVGRPPVKDAVPQIEGRINRKADPGKKDGRQKDSDEEPGRRFFGAVQKEEEK